MTSETQNELFRTFRELLERTAVHAALLAASVQAAADMVRARIAVVEAREGDSRDRATAMSQEVRSCRFKPRQDSVGGDYAIVVPQVTPDNLMHVRFRIAHELGHIVLGHEFLDMGAPDNEKDRKEADLFAALLLRSRGPVTSRHVLSREDLLEALQSLRGKDEAAQVVKAVEEAADTVEGGRVRGGRAHYAPPYPEDQGEGAVETDESHLVYMSQCIRHIQRYADGGRSALMGSSMVLDAVLWNLQLISLAALRLSDECKRRHPEVDWKRVGTLFRELVGDPWRVEPERVWERLEGELDHLKSCVRTMLAWAAARH